MITCSQFETWIMPNKIDKRFFDPKFRKPVWNLFSNDAILAYQCISVPGTVGLVFLGSWVYAVYTWGWLLGLSLGWMPAAILAAISGFIAYYLWFIAFPILIIVYFSLLYQLLEFVRTWQGG